MRQAKYSRECMLNLFSKTSNKGEAMDMLRDSKGRKLTQNTLPAFQMAGFPKLSEILSANMLYWSNKQYLYYQLQSTGCWDQMPSAKAGAFISSRIVRRG